MRQTLIASALAGSFALAGLAAYVVFTDSAHFQPAPPNDDDYGAPQFSFELVAFDSLEGWAAHDPSPALPAFLRSCERVLAASPGLRANPLEALGGPLSGLSIAGVAEDWAAACEEAARGGVDDADAARAFFERHFRPLRIFSLREPRADVEEREPLIETRGLFTGYFEPAYLASSRPTPEFSAPVYARPEDLVMVDLGAFREEYAGVRLAGSVVDGKLVPYPDHRAINEGALENRARPLAWMDPNDLLFLQIQGSGRLRLMGHGEIRVGYAGQNGHAYTPIGRFLVESGALSLENVSMQSIRAWLDAAPADEARALREKNASYVFFRLLDDLPSPELGPLGADGVQLTPGRSLAVDRRYHALGAPVWVALEAGAVGDDPFRRLMIAQDTGGAIRGPVRGDIFFGAGPEAAAVAGRLRAAGEFFIFAPLPVVQRIEAAAEPRA